MADIDGFLCRETFNEAAMSMRRLLGGGAALAEGTEGVKVACPIKYRLLMPHSWGTIIRKSHNTYVVLHRVRLSMVTCG
jgi:hypothetical protein